MRIIIVVLTVLLTATSAIALRRPLPTVGEVETALHLTRGAAFTINIGGQQIELTFVGIEPQHGHRFAIIVEAY